MWTIIFRKKIPTNHTKWRAGRKEQVFLLEDMLTKVEFKHLVEAGDNV